MFRGSDNRYWLPLMTPECSRKMAPPFTPALPVVSTPSPHFGGTRPEVCPLKMSMTAVLFRTPPSSPSSFDYSSLPTGWCESGVRPELFSDFLHPCPFRSRASCILICRLLFSSSFWTPFSGVPSCLTWAGRFPFSLRPALTTLLLLRKSVRSSFLSTPCLLRS